jgi:hypothetical protein
MECNFCLMFRGDALQMDELAYYGTAVMQAAKHAGTFQVNRLAWDHTLNGQLCADRCLGALSGLSSPILQSNINSKVTHMQAQAVSEISSWSVVRAALWGWRIATRPLTHACSATIISIGALVTCFDCSVERGRGGVRD